MRYCMNCGKEIQEDEKFCQACGTAVDKKRGGMDSVNSEVQNQWTQETQSFVNIPIAGYNPKWDYTPIGMWGYFFYNILFAIPLVGQIFLLVFAFGGTKNINLRNYARSFFCFAILLIVIAAIISSIASSF